MEDENLKYGKIIWDNSLNSIQFCTGNSLWRHSTKSWKSFWNKLMLVRYPGNYVETDGVWKP